MVGHTSPHPRAAARGDLLPGDAVRGATGRTTPVAPRRRPVCAPATEAAGACSQPGVARGRPHRAAQHRQTRCSALTAPAVRRTARDGPAPRRLRVGVTHVVHRRMSRDSCAPEVSPLRPPQRAARRRRPGTRTAAAAGRAGDAHRRDSAPPSQPRAPRASRRCPGWPQRDRSAVESRAKIDNRVFIGDAYADCRAAYVLSTSCQIRNLRRSLGRSTPEEAQHGESEAEHGRARHPEQKG